MGKSISFPWHDSTASPGIQDRLGMHHRIYQLEY